MKCPIWSRSRVLRVTVNDDRFQESSPIRLRWKRNHLLAVEYDFDGKSSTDHSEKHLASSSILQRRMFSQTTGRIKALIHSLDLALLTRNCSNYSLFAWVNILGNVSYLNFRTQPKPCCSGTIISSTGLKRLPSLRYSSAHLCDSCSGLRVSDGYRTIVICQNLFGIKFLPVLFVSCTPQCLRKLLMNETDQSPMPVSDSLLVNDHLISKLRMRHVWY